MVGTFISSYSEVKMFKLLDNSISTQTSAYIEKYDILEEYKELDKYVVKAKVWVNVSRLYDNLGIRMISTREEKENNYSTGIIIINSKLTDESYSGIMLNNTGMLLYKPAVFVYPFNENGNAIIVPSGYTAILQYANNGTCHPPEDFIRPGEYFNYSKDFSHLKEIKDVDVVVEGYDYWYDSPLRRYKVYFVKVGEGTI